MAAGSDIPLMVDPIDLLALRWTELCAGADPVTSVHLARVLQRLADLLVAEPFCPKAARELGVGLLATGLCGHSGPPAPGIEDVLAPTLGLLRQAAPVLGVSSTGGRRRLDAALDELATGFARGVRERLRQDGPPRPGDEVRRLAAVPDGQVLDLYPSAIPEQRTRLSHRTEWEARSALLTALREGVDRDEFRLVFQPLVTLTDGRVRGAEALVRWQHPTEGLIGPGRFIQLAEISGAIVPLGRWVLATACAQAAAWGRELGGGCGADAPYVSVNVSPVQLVESRWVDDVHDVLAATGLAPERLQLEITEQAVLDDETAAFDALTTLRDTGVRIALDDFGTGYSSFAWLRRLPVHALKIDGSFVDGLRHPDADTVDLSIVRALVELAHALDLEVTAEWIETGVQAQRLAALGCDIGQGRWFGDAGPAEWVPGLWRRTLPLGGSGP